MLRSRRRGDMLGSYGAGLVWDPMRTLIYMKGSTNCKLPCNIRIMLIIPGPLILQPSTERKRE